MSLARLSSFLTSLSKCCTLLNTDQSVLKVAPSSARARLACGNAKGNAMIADSVTIGGVVHVVADPLLAVTTQREPHTLMLVCEGMAPNPSPRSVRSRLQDGSKQCAVLTHSHSVCFTHQERRGPPNNHTRAPQHRRQARASTRRLGRIVRTGGLTGPPPKPTSRSRSRAALHVPQQSLYTDTPTVFLQAVYRHAVPLVVISHLLQKSQPFHWVE